MNRERMMVLKMVADGTISAEEGARLLDVLGAESQRDEYGCEPIQYFVGGGPDGEFECKVPLPGNFFFAGPGAPGNCCMPCPPAPPFDHLIRWAADLADSDADAEPDPGDYV